MLIENGAILGAAALEEVAAAGRHSTAGILGWILSLSKSDDPQSAGGFRGVLPTINSIPKPAEGERPWQVAGRLARFARAQWGLGERPVNDEFLTDLLKATPENLQCNDRLLPATAAKTARQQFQRAFAQEFLCPFDALLAKIQTEKPDEEDIAEAATDYDVSPLMVLTTLVNRGSLDREALNAAV